MSAGPRQRRAVPRRTSAERRSEHPALRFRAGTDVGGTFTDLWVIADDGRQAAVKAPTTADIISGVGRAVELAAGHFGLSMREFCASVDHFGHGTTAGLNALLTGSAARTALVRQGRHRTDRHRRRPRVGCAGGGGLRRGDDAAGPRRGDGGDRGADRAAVGP